MMRSSAKQNASVLFHATLQFEHQMWDEVSLRKEFLLSDADQI